MESSFFPKLSHLACSKIILSIFNHHEVDKNFSERDCETIYSQMNESISSIKLPPILEVKLKWYMYAIYKEIKEWYTYSLPINYFIDFRQALLDTIPLCWLPNGTIDRNKSVSMLVKNDDVFPVNRFVFACLFCLYSDILDLWTVLSRIEKAFLRTIPFVQLWIQFLESNLSKCWDSFITWALGTPLWYNNAFLLKHAFKILSPAERIRRVLEAFSKEKIRDDVMLVCFPLMTKEEKELSFIEVTIHVFCCLLSWPFRAVFDDMVEHLWPYFTEETFSQCIVIIITRLEERNDGELLIILQRFWAQSPNNFKNFVREEKGRSVFPRLEPILNVNGSKTFVDGRLSSSDYNNLKEKIRPRNDILELLMYLF